MEPKDIFEVSDPRVYIRNLDEDTLIDRVIIPLYQKRNFVLIRRPLHGPGEHGKDIIFRKKDSFPTPVYHAIQVKAVKIDVNNVGKIIDQARAAFNVSFTDPYFNNQTKVDFVDVITSDRVTDDAEVRFYEEVPDRRHINLIRGEQLLDLIEQTKRAFCEIDVLSTSTTLPQAKIPSNVFPSADIISTTEKTGRLPWEKSVEMDLKKLKEEIREGKLPESDEEVIKTEEKKFSKMIPLETEKGQLLYYREIIQRDTTRISIIPSLPSKIEPMGVRPIERPHLSLELSPKLKGIIESLSEPERKVIDILNYCNGVDENTLKCITAIEGLDGTALEAIKEKEIISYTKETLNLPASFAVEKMRIIDEAQCYLSLPSQTSKEEYNSALIRALNVCNECIPLILSIIDEKYNELSERSREELMKYILHNRKDRSIVYFASRFSHKDYTLVELGEKILSEDIDKEQDHRTYSNFGTALLVKNTGDGINIDSDAIDKNEIENAKSFLEIACDLDKDNAKYLAALSIALVLHGDLNTGIFNAQIALKINEHEPNALTAISIGYILKGNLNAALPYLEKHDKIKPDCVTNLLNLGNVYKGLKMFDKALEAFERADSLKSNTDNIIAEIGVVHQNLGNVNDALTIFENAIELNPMCELAWLGKGDLYFNKFCDLPKAVESYERATQINENNPNGWVALAQSYDRLDDYENAKKCIEKAIKKNPSTEFALLGIGAFYANRGMVEECEKWCGEIIKENHKNAKALECIGVAYNNAKKFEKAIDFFNKALDIDPTQSNIIYEKAVSTYALKNVQEARKLYEDVIKLNPNNIRALLELSKILCNEGNYDTALELLTHAEIESSEDSEFPLILGAVYANKKEYGTAIEFFERSIKLNPKNVYGWLNIGKIYINTLNNSKAKQYFEKGLEIEPDNIMLLEGLVISCLNLRLSDDAIQHCGRILQLEPSHSAAYYYTAEAYGLKRDYDESIRYYEKLLELEPNNRSAILGLCRVYISSGKISTAKKLFNRLRKESKGDPQVSFEISMVWRDCGRYNEAIYYLNKAIDADPKGERFYIGKANIYLRLGKHDEAIRSCEKALKINPKSSTALYQMGIFYLAKNNNLRAIVFFERSNAIVSNNASSWFNLGIAYNKLGNKLKAKECFKYALQYGPLNVEMLSVVGDFYKIAMNDFNNAINCYEKASSLGRGDSRIKIVLATCYLNIEKLDGCIKCCKDVLNKDPENIEALVLESIAWLFKGNYDNPDENLRKALLLQPNNYLTMLGLALFHNNKEHAQEAIDWAKKGIEKDPKNSNNGILYLIIGNNYNLMGMYEDAIKNFEYARKYELNYLNILRLGGFPLINLKRYPEAIEWWREYLKLRPDDWEFWYYIGVTYGYINDFENGIECLEKASSLKASEKSIYYALGNQYTRSGNHQKAMQIYQELKSLDSNSSEPWLLTGDIYFNVINEFEKAVSEYLDAMDINPDNWKAWANLSIASNILGETEKSKVYLEKAIQQCSDKVELFIREIIVFLRINKLTEAEQSAENALAEFPKSHILWFLKACIASINMDVETAIKSLEKAINLNDECISFALTEPNLEYLRTQECFKDLIEKN